MIRKRKKSSGKKFISEAIKRPGALTKRLGGKVTVAKAKKLAKSKSSSTLAKREANFYTNVLAPANAKRRGRRKKGY